MSYNPPSESNWYYTGPFLQYCADAYNAGYNDAKEGKPYVEPNEPSGHERDTTYKDEENYWYYSGYYSYELA